MNLRQSQFKHWVGVTAAVGLASAMSVGSAFGFGAIFTIDNQGNAYWNNGGGLVPYTLATEPNSGTTALQYTLPFSAVTGDVLLETSNGGPVTDILRFEGANAYFFSTTGVGTLGYVASLPAAISPSVGPFVLVDGGGTFSYQYTPATGQPGFDADAPGSIYNIIVAVPEPGVLGLSALGASFMLLFRSRRDKAQG